jgi:hypothetical protein
MTKIKLFLTLCLVPETIIFAQNVGIGTTDPQDKLHISTGNISVENNTTNYPWLSFRNSNQLKGYIGVQTDNLRIGTWPGSNTNGHIALVTNNIDRFKVMPNGDVGIAASTPRGLFDIGGADEPIYFASNTTTGNQRIAYMPGNIFMAPWSGTNTSYLDARRSNNSGNTTLTIRTTRSGILENRIFLSDNYKIAFNHANNPVGNIDFQSDMLIRSSNAEINTQLGHFIESTQNFTTTNELIFYNYNVLNNTYTALSKIAANGSYIQLSDRAVKENIRPLASALSLVNKMNPVSYNDINNTAVERTGFIAQEVEVLFPSLVEKVVSKNGNTYKGINYAGLSVVAIKAIQEQQQEIESLKKEIKELKQLIHQQ